MLREGRKKDWIDLSPKERAREIEFLGCPVAGSSHVRNALWFRVTEAVHELVEEV